MKHIFSLSCRRLRITFSHNAYRTIAIRAAATFSQTLFRSLPNRCTKYLNLSNTPYHKFEYNNYQYETLNARENVCDIYIYINIIPVRAKHVKNKIKK